MRTLAAYLILAALLTAPAHADEAADALLARYVEASGGAQRLAAAHTRISESVTQAGWLKMSTRTVQIWPDRVLIEGKLPLIGTAVSSGYDGATGWAPGDGGPRRVSGRELNEFVLHQRLDRMVRLTELYPQRQSLPPVAGGDAAPRVAMDTAFGTQELWTFDPRTALLRSVEAEQDGGPKKGLVKLTMRYGDYRAVQGLTLPFLATLEDGKSKLTVKLTKLELFEQPQNIPIAAPADLKAQP